MPLFRSLTVALCGLPLVLGSTVDHRYKDGEHVELWVNKVRLATTDRYAW
jgi:hypothetical protein